MSTSNALSIFGASATSQPICHVNGGEDDSTRRSFLRATLSRVHSSHMPRFTTTGTTGDTKGDRKSSPSQGGEFEPPSAGSVDLFSIPILVFTKRDQEGQVETLEGSLILHQNAKGVYADLPHGPTIMVRMPVDHTPRPIDPSLVCVISFFHVGHSVLYGANVPAGIPYRVARSSEGGVPGLTIDIPPECAPVDQGNFPASDDYLLAFLKLMQKVVDVAWWGVVIWDIALVAGVARMLVRAPGEPRAHVN